jgi:adenylate kinase family enzyme
MRRIAVIGCSGGGKSTLARALGARLGLPVTHIDTLFWKPGWVEGDREELRLAVEAVAATDAWVIDGNFFKASAERFHRADTIVWIDLPRLACLWRASRRAVLGFGRTRPDLAPGCPEKIDFEFYRYIWTWDHTTRPLAEATIATHGAGARLVRLRSDREAVAWLEAAAEP